MYRPLGSSLLALPMIILLSAGASAQTRYGAPDSYEPTQKGLMGIFQQEAQMQNLDPRDREVESDSLPPPGLPQSGHQFGDQPRTQYAPPNDAIRPPAGIGPGQAQQQPSQMPPQASAPAPQGGQPNQTSVMSLPADDQPEQGQPKELPPNLKKQLVDFGSKEPAGTIVVDTANTYLYLVLGGGKALRYGVRVGRDGFTWTGTERISRMREWPDWHPPAEMIERQPYLPRFMAGGNGNPLGARAMYLGSTLYRIHGTNQPSTIGTYVSSGCVGMLNEDVEDLFSRVQVGTRVVVLPGRPPETLANAGPPPAANPMAPPSQVRSSLPQTVAPANNQGGVNGSALPPAR